MDKLKKVFNRLLKSRSLRYGSNSILLIAIVVAMAVVINVIVGMVPAKLDLTSNKLYSIGDTTKTILKGLNKDVTIYALFDEVKASSDAQVKQVNEILVQYKKYDHVKIEYVDPDKHPGFLKEINPNPTDTTALDNANFVVKSGNKIKALSTYDLYDIQMDQQTYQQYAQGLKAEQGFSGAIKYVTSDVTPTVYFTEGHQENAVDQKYTTVKKYLGMNNYAIKSVNLLMQKTVPSDAAILVVASPKQDLSVDERDKIKDYLKKGGKAIFLFDSLENDPKFPEMEKLLADYNIGLNYDKVQENDDNRHVPQNPYDVVPEVQSNTINTNLDPSNFVMVMPTSRSLNILKNNKEHMIVTSLMKTSDKAVGIQIDKTAGKDISGPLDLAIATENQLNGSTSAKVLVIGNANFMSDSEMGKYGEYSQNAMLFFLNSVNWMQDKKDDVMIAPKSYDIRSMDISDMQAKTSAVMMVIILPLLIFGAGTFVWMRRRHL